MAYYLSSTSMLTTKNVTRILGLSAFFLALTPTAFARSIDDFAFPSSSSSQSSAASSASSESSVVPSTLYTSPSSSSSQKKIDFWVKVKPLPPRTTEERMAQEAVLPETRAGFVSMIVKRLYNNVTIDTCFWNIASELPPDFTLVFSDVHVTHTYAKEICVAMNNGIIKGYGDGSFRPNDRVTFAEASKMISRAYALNPWPDATVSEPWFDQYVRTLDDHAAIPASVTAFDQRMTRTDMGEILDRLDGRITSRPVTSMAALQADWKRRYMQPVRKAAVRPVVRQVSPKPSSSSSSSASSAPESDASWWNLIPVPFPASSPASSSTAALPASSAASAAASSQASSSKSYPGWIY